MINDSGSRKHRIFNFLIYFSIAAGLSLLIRFTTHHLWFGDSHIYRQMAENPFRFVSFPQSYRILVPLIVWSISKIISLSVSHSYYIVSTGLFISIIISIIYWFKSVESLPLKSAILIACMYGFSFAGVQNLHNFIHFGFGEHLIILLGIIAIRKRNFLFLSLVILIGSAVKETSLILVPIYFIFELHHNRFSIVLKKSFLLTLLGCGMLLFIRSGIIFSDSFPSKRANFFKTYFHYVLSHQQNFFVLLKLFFKTYHIIIPLSFLGFLYTPGKMKPIGLLIPITILQVLIAVDIERMFAVGFPAYLFFICFLFKKTDYRDHILFTILEISAFYIIHWITVPLFRESFLLFSTVFILLWIYFRKKYKKLEIG